MSVTLDTSRFEMSKFDNAASQNRNDMSVALDTSHAETSLFDKAALGNVPFRNVSIK